MRRGLQVHIPLTSICTLKCITCIRGTDLDYLSISQSVSEFEKIINRLADLKEPVRNIDLTSIIGETSQDPNLEEKLEILEKADHILGYDFVSNLLPHKSVDIVDILSNSKFSKMAPVFISVYGMDESTFTSYTKTNKKSWKTFSTNLEQLLDKTFSKESKKINLYFRFDHYEAKTETPLYSKIKILNKMGKVHIDDSSACANYDWAGRHPSIEKLAKIPKQTGMCLHAVEQNCVWPNGDVSQCGMVDYNKEMIKGNIYNELSILTINKMHALCEGCREYELE